MFYIFYMTGYFVANILPLKLSYFVAEVIARLYYLFSGKDKAGLRENLKVILNGTAGEREINRHVLNVFRNFAKYLADFFKFPRFSKEYIQRKIKFQGEQHISECLAEGKGLILVSLHLGNWELGGAIVGALNYPASAIVLEHKSKAVDDFFVRQRAINGLKSIPMANGIKGCFDVLKNNEVLAIVGDKDFSSNGISIDFFGKKAQLPRGPAFFSLKTGAPIVVCAMVRMEDDSFTFYFNEPIKYMPTGNREKDVEGIMGLYIRQFEDFINEYPDQWYAFGEVWPQK